MPEMKMGMGVVKSYETQTIDSIPRDDPYAQMSAF
jgi:hypothetical protein